VLHTDRQFLRAGRRARVVEHVAATTRRRSR
jgi:hypothetical protein